MNKTERICLIKQPAGIGDIFFLLKMVKHYINIGYKVIFPIYPQLMFIKDYIIIDGLEFCSISDDFNHKNDYLNGSHITTENLIVIPTQNVNYGGSCMEAKYQMVGLDYNGWQEYFTFNRNFIKENELYYNVLGLKDDEKYTLISKTWGTQPNFASKDVYYESKDNVVEIKLIDGYTLFDWSKVIEKANEISIVDTSFNYIIEKLDINAKKLFLNSRFTPSNFSHIINLFKKDWIYIN